MRKMTLIALVAAGLIWAQPVASQLPASIRDGEDSHGQRREKKGDPSRAMICAGEPRMRAIVREVIATKDSTFVELKSNDWQGKLYFKKGSEIFRFLYGRAQNPGCFDVRFDRTQSSNFSRNFAYKVGPYTFDCFWWGSVHHCNSDQRSYSGNKMLDQWLIEIKNRAESNQLPAETTSPRNSGQ